MKKIRALIVDDEPPARKKMRTLLKPAEDVEVIGECENGQDALEAIASDPPDVVFLDIQMPIMTGFDVVNQVGVDAMPLVIFTTAFDEFAVEAFEKHALDYLLKPIDPARLDKTLERIRRLRAEDSREHLDGLVQHLRQSKEYVQRLAIKSRDKIAIVKAADIDWIRADGNYVSVCSGGKEHLLRETLRHLEDTLDAQEFARVHRSYIVRVERVKELKTDAHGDYSAVMRDGTVVPVSRSYKSAFLERFRRDA